MKLIKGVSLIFLGLSCFYWKFKYPPEDGPIASNFGLLIAGFFLTLSGILVLVGYFDE